MERGEETVLEGSQHKEMEKQDGQEARDLEELNMRGNEQRDGIGAR